MNPNVAKIGQINISGNIIPPNWYKAITYTNSKGTYCDLLAVNILSDIVYWYRPTIVRDEKSGEVTEFKKKFKADKLQKNYFDYAKMFTCSDKMVKGSFKLLTDLGLITTELRNVKSEKGGIIPNRMFVDVVPERIAEITAGSFYIPPKWDTPSPPNGMDDPSQMGHNTYITNTEINDTNTEEICLVKGSKKEIVIDVRITRIQEKWNKFAKIYNLAEVHNLSNNMMMHIQLKFEQKGFEADFDAVLEKLPDCKKLLGIGRGVKKADSVTLLGLLTSEKLFTAILRGEHDIKPVTPSLTFEQAYGSKRADFISKLKEYCQSKLGFSNIDGNYYYSAVSTWADKTAGKVSANWIAEGMNFINRDYSSKDGDKVRYEKVVYNGIPADYGTG